MYLQIFKNIHCYVNLNNCTTKNTRKAAHFYALNAKILSFLKSVQKKIKTDCDNTELFEYRTIIFINLAHYFAPLKVHLFYMFHPMPSDLNDRPQIDNLPATVTIPETTVGGFQLITLTFTDV